MSHRDINPDNSLPLPADLLAKYRPKAVPPGPLEHANVAKKPKADKPPRQPIKPKNKDRAAKTHEEDYGPCSRMARFGRCAVPDCSRLGRTVGVPREDEPERVLEAAHVQSRGSGGRDHANVIGLCLWHHREQSNAGIETFQRRHGFSMAEEAKRVAERVSEHACVDYPERRRDGSTRCEICRATIRKPTRNHDCLPRLVEDPKRLDYHHACLVCGRRMPAEELEGYQP